MALNATENCTVGNVSACNATDLLVTFKPNWFRLVVLIPSIIVILICTFVIFVLLRIRELRSVTNALIVNAATADLLRGLVGIFNTYMYLKPIPYDHTHTILCEAILFLHLGQTFWSSWSIAALAYDRYDLLSRPLNRRLRKKQVVILITTIVTTSFFFASLPIYSGWSDYLLHPMKSNPSFAKCRYTHIETNAFDWSFQPVFDFCSVILPVVFVAIFYGMIVKIVVQHRRRAAIARSTIAMTIFNQSASVDSSRKSVISNDDSEKVLRTLENETSPVSVIRTKAFQLVTAVILTNIALMLPFVVVAELEKFRVIVIRVFPDRIKSVLMALFHFNFVVNSVLYLFWIRNAIRMARRRGLQSGGKTVQMLKVCCP